MNKKYLWDICVKYGISSAELLLFNNESCDLCNEEKREMLEIVYVDENYNEQIINVCKNCFIGGK